jgi:hypothetical protein
MKHFFIFYSAEIQIHRNYFIPEEIKRLSFILKIEKVFLYLHPQFGQRLRKVLRT